MSRNATLDAEGTASLLENFAPGVMDRLGVGWEVLHRVNPRLVYASGSGYGLTGPDRDNLAMDLTIQAVSGLIAATGFPDGPPVKARPAFRTGRRSRPARRSSISFPGSISMPPP
jgi:crotonobetainyl-CoA:carnitine CoA-transferase CaiB-like acyl-CoA transferase